MRSPMPPRVKKDPTSAALMTRTTRSVAVSFEESSLYGTPKIKVTNSGPRKSMRTVKRVQNATVSSKGHSLRSSARVGGRMTTERDRKSTRLNSSHSQISYAVFCLKKKKKSLTNDHHKTSLHI